MTGAANDGGEHGPGGIVSGEASLHKAGAVVAHKGGSLIVVTHVGFCKEQRRESLHQLVTADGDAWTQTLFSPNLLLSELLQAEKRLKIIATSTGA